MQIGSLQTVSPASLQVTQLLFKANFGNSLSQDPGRRTSLPLFWVNIGAMPINTKFKVLLLTLYIKQALGILPIHE